MICDKRTFSPHHASPDRPVGHPLDNPTGAALNPYRASSQPMPLQARPPIGALPEQSSSGHPHLDRRTWIMAQCRLDYQVHPNTFGPHLH